MPRFGRVSEGGLYWRGMVKPMIAPYGRWKAPINGDLGGGKFTGVGGLRAVGVAVCRPGAGRITRAADLRARGPWRGRTAGEHAGGGGPGKRREPRAGERQRLLFQPAAKPGWAAAGVAELEPSEHALGRHRTVG